MKNQQIEKGDVVLYQNKWYKVKTCFKHTVNLGSVFGSPILLKQVPINEVKEDYSNWYMNWQKSDTYKCM